MYWVPCVWASLSYFVRICLYHRVYKTIQFYSKFDGFTTTLISLLPALLTSLWSIDSEQIETVYGYQITHASPLKKKNLLFHKVAELLTQHPSLKD